MEERKGRSDGPSAWIIAQDDGAQNIRGSRCRSCDRLAAPADRFGCLNCGAPPEEIDLVSFSGRGVLINAVTVHQQLLPTAAAPLVIGRIALEEGPVVSAQIGALEQDLLPNCALEARLVETGATDTLELAWHFFPIEEA